ncbi:MAG: hypothetical protein A2511_15375 [Deltaproteobacteria bacterium RIFOXYD12_FULL_50_9]|nr:MAG: hypothetical protein A2511_15375 [Deltaproteobacteria bacterium RIFOXYD12_FULL_50_9]
MIYEWDETKRQANIEKHGLDFEDARLVYESRYRFELPIKRSGEERLQVFAYVFDLLTVLTLVVTRRSERVRCISFRRAHTEEIEVYHDWLANEFKE